MKWGLLLLVICIGCEGNELFSDTDWDADTGTQDNGSPVLPDYIDAKTSSKSGKRRDERLFQNKESDKDKDDNNDELLGRTVVNPTTGPADDMIFDPSTKHTPSKNGRANVAKKEAFLEVFAVIDFDCYNKFQKNEVKLQRYYRTLVFETNKRYKKLPEPRIKVVLTGIHYMKASEAQPFYEAQRQEFDTQRDAKVAVLQGFGRWVKRRAKEIPKHDVAAFITCTQSKTTLGMAYVGAVCQKESKSFNGYMAIAWVQDMVGTLQGVGTFTHELAHSMGAVHDSQDEAQGCPKQGHIMCPGCRRGANETYFSDCSRRSLTETLSTKEASCVYKKNFKGPWVEDITPAELDRETNETT